MTRTGLTLAILAIGAFGSLTASASADDPTIALGSAESFAVLGQTAVSNTGPTAVAGDLGVAPGGTIGGFPPGTVVGSIHAGDATAASAQADLGTAYAAAVAYPTTSPSCTLIAGDLAGRTLTPGVYCAGAAIGISGPLTLDFGGDPNAFFLFKIDAALGEAAATEVKVVNTGAGNETCAPNTFWQVNGAVTIGAAATFTGDILSHAAITAGAGATLTGRALSRSGIVTLADNTVSRCITPPADLSVGVTGDPASVAPGGSAHYAVTAVNGGPGDAAAAAMTATLPKDLGFAGIAAPSGWSCLTPAVGSSGVVRCTSTSMAVGSAAFSLTATADPAVAADEVVTLSVTVASSSDDPDSADRSATADTRIAVVAAPAATTPTAPLVASSPASATVTPPVPAGVLPPVVKRLAACTSVRRFTVHLARRVVAAGTRVTKAILVDVRGHTLRTMTVGRTSVDVDMRGLGGVRATLRITTRRGARKATVATRAYRTCSVVA